MAEKFFDFSDCIEHGRACAHRIDHPSGKEVRDDLCEFHTHRPFLPIEFYVGRGKKPVVLDCILDTGSSVTVLPEKFAKKIGIPLTEGIGGSPAPRFIKLSTPAGPYQGTVCDAKFRVAMGDAAAKFHECRLAHAKLHDPVGKKVKKFISQLGSWSLSSPTVNARPKGKYGILAYRDLAKYYDIRLSPIYFGVRLQGKKSVVPHHMGMAGVGTDTSTES